MELSIISLLIFIVTVVIIELIILAYRNMRSPNRGEIRKRLRKFIYAENEMPGTEILRKRVLSDIPFLNEVLLRIPAINKIDDLVIQANAKYQMGFYILLSLFLAIAGFLAGNMLLKNNLFALILPISFFFMPLLFLMVLKKKRIAKFRRQLPEALDLISRALKAGHAFTSGMKMVADEFEDPLGPEFGEVLDEVNFGVSMHQALKNLALRIECSELRYFVVGVILQREIGGNLSELMEILSHLIREKFKFAGRVKTLAAEGKLSAIILVAIPFFIAGYLQFSSPNYLVPLFEDPVGRMMVLFGVIMMVIGIIVMKKMITIEV
jgi:tight adherence protein B